MKQVKNFLIAAALILGLSNAVNAQSKVAHIASQELVNQMPAYKSAMGELEKLQNTYDAEIKNMLTELQNTVKRFQAEETTKTQEENAKRAGELQNTEKTTRALEAKLCRR